MSFFAKSKFVARARGVLSHDKESSSGDERSYIHSRPKSYNSFLDVKVSFPLPGKKGFGRIAIDVEHLLGEGAEGTAYLAYPIDNKGIINKDIKLVVKRLIGSRKEKENKAILELAQQGAAHTHAYYDCLFVMGKGADDMDIPMILMPFFPGKNVYDLRIKNVFDSLTVRQQLKLCRSIVLALMEFHSNRPFRDGLIHHDIKEENIMVDIIRNQQGKVIDFDVHIIDIGSKRITDLFASPDAVEAAKDPKSLQHVLPDEQNLPNHIGRDFYSLLSVLITVLGGKKVEQDKSKKMDELADKNNRLSHQSRLEVASVPFYFADLEAKITRQYPPAEKAGNLIDESKTHRHNCLQDLMAFFESVQERYGEEGIVDECLQKINKAYQSCILYDDAYKEANGQASEARSKGKHSEEKPVYQPVNLRILTEIYDLPKPRKINAIVARSVSDAGSSPVESASGTASSSSASSSSPSCSH